MHIGKHKQATTEGVLQGWPLSPVLTNVVLDELDWKLEGRGHSFTRYADDCNIFVKSHSGPVFLRGIHDAFGDEVVQKG